MMIGLREFCIPCSLIVLLPTAGCWKAVTSPGDESPRDTRAVSSGDVDTGSDTDRDSDADTDIDEDTDADTGNDISTADTGSTPLDTEYESDSTVDCIELRSSIWNGWREAHEAFSSCVSDEECKLTSKALPCYETVAVAAVRSEQEADYQIALEALAEELCVPSCAFGVGSAFLPPQEAYCDGTSCEIRCPYRLDPIGTNGGGGPSESDGTCENIACPEFPEVDMLRCMHPNHCCTADGACGVSNGDVLGDACFGRNQPGEPDEACPSVPFTCAMDDVIAITPTYDGCCRPDGTCGVDTEHLGAGCVELKLFQEALVRGCWGLNSDDVPVDEPVACAP